MTNMAFDVGAAVVRLQGDTTELKTALDGVGSLGKGAVGALKGVTVAIAAMGTAAVAFAIGSAVKFSEVGDEVEKMSKRTGLAAESVSALRVAADASATSLGTIENAIKKMAVTNITAADASDELKHAMMDVDETFDNLAKADPAAKFEAFGNVIGNIRDPLEKARVAVELFGKSGTELIPLFEDGSFSFEEWSKKAKELGVSFDDLSAKQAAQLNDAFGEMKSRLLGLALAVGSTVAPAILDLWNKAQPSLNQLGDFLKVALPAALATTQQFIQALLDKARELWQQLEDAGIIAMFRAALEAVWSTITNQLVPAITKLIATVKAHWDQLKPFVEFLGAFVVVSLLAVMGAVKLVIDMIVVWIGWIGDAITAWANFKQNVIGMWNDIKTAAANTWAEITSSITNAINTVMAPINNFLATLAQVKNAVSSSFSNLGANLGLSGKRAMGGPVSMGGAYLVGERGPEIFVPNANGSIVPNGAGGGVTIHINNPVVDSASRLEELTRAVESASGRALELSRLGLNPA